MENCLFCKIKDKTVAADIVYEDKDFLAFKDINPKAPLHLLIIPKKHIPSINYLNPEDENLIGKMFLVASEIAKKQKVFNKGYRLIINVGRDAGQEIDHLHLHLLAGKNLSWPKY